MSIRKKIVAKFIKKWLYKYHFSKNKPVNMFFMLSSPTYKKRRHFSSIEFENLALTLSYRNNFCMWMKNFNSNLCPLRPLTWGISCSRKKYIFEYSKHFVQDIRAQVCFHLHRILKAFASPTSHFSTSRT